MLKTISGEHNRVVGWILENLVTTFTDEPYKSVSAASGRLYSSIQVDILTLITCN